MCGIAGQLRFDNQPINQDRLIAMRQSLTCRGPNDHGISTNDRCGLVHTRLSVIDIDHGHQPMTAQYDNQSLTVSFNGEIYNHRDLRHTLQSAGYQFATDHCDTEILLHGYDHWGTQLPTRLNGMFAFAIYDSSDQSLFIARDRLGQKPLYYHHGDTAFSFASTLDALTKNLAQKQSVSTDSLIEYLTFGYCISGTILQDILELPPACYMHIQRDNQSVTQRYWSVSTADLQVTQQATKNETQTTADVEQLLTHAVSSRLEADVPLGCFLSGGIDSSLIAAIAQKAMKATGSRLKTFSVSMPDARYDEGPFAKQVAEHLGTEHLSLRAEPNVEEDLKCLIQSMGEPFADSSLLPTYWLSKMTRQHVTVAISGDGGDELFGGYNRYRAMNMIHRYRWLKFMPRFLFNAADQKSKRHQIGRLLKSAKCSSPSNQYRSMIQLFDESQLAELGFTQPSPSLDWSSNINSSDAARFWDINHYLPGDLLRKVDRASMAVALEVRSPFLDHALVERIAPLSLNYLMAGQQPKRMLKKIAAPYLPQSIIDRPKMGFALPIGLWFKDSLKDMLTGYLLDGPLDTLSFNRPAIEQLIREHHTGQTDHTHRLFALLSLSIWLTN